MYEILNYYIDHAERTLGGQTTLTPKIYDNGNTNSNKPIPPFLRITIPGNDQCNFSTVTAPQRPRSVTEMPVIVLYTHADIQPFKASEWTTTTDPLVTKRITTEDRDGLYGRGTTDDKYAFFASIIVVQTFMKLNLCHPKIHIVVETEEESSSPNLHKYMDELIKDLQVQPEILYVLDTGGPDNDHFWNTRTLRGLLTADLTVKITENSVHSGTAGGIVPSPFRLMNELILEHLEELDGTIIAPSLMYRPTEIDRESALKIAALLGDKVLDLLPWIPGASPIVDPTKTPSMDDIVHMLLRNYYKPSLTVVGFDHAVTPDIGMGGNVIQPYIKVRLSLRCSPYTDVDAAFDELKKTFETGPHRYGASVELTKVSSSEGFAANPLPAFYSSIVDDASEQLYDGKPMMDSGLGGTIGFLSTIKEALHEAFGNYNTIMHSTGLFDPTASGHSKDESLDVDAVKKFNSVLTYTMHQVMVDHVTGSDGSDFIAVGDTTSSGGDGDNHSSSATTLLSTGTRWWVFFVASIAAALATNAA